MNKVLTIIIPSYNTEKYIDTGLPTLINTKELALIEILLINDGSTDKTLDKLKYYQAVYTDSIRVIDKENGGHGSVINTGVRAARGKYVKVIDGDDWVETKNLDKLVSFLLKNDVDMICNPFYRVNCNNGNKVLCGIYNRVPYGRILDFESVPDDVIDIQFHELTFKTSIFTEHNIRLSEHCFYDDAQYKLYPIPYVKKILFLNYPIYDYLVDQANQSVSDDIVYKNYQMSKNVGFESLDYYDKLKHNLNSRSRKYMHDTIVNGLKQHYNIYLRNYQKKNAFNRIIEFDNELKEKNNNMRRNVAKQFMYIAILQRHNHIAFKMMGIMFKIYKKVVRKK